MTARAIILAASTFRHAKRHTRICNCSEFAAGDRFDKFSINFVLRDVSAFVIRRYIGANLFKFVCFGNPFISHFVYTANENTIVNVVCDQKNVLFIGQILAR